MSKIVTIHQPNYLPWIGLFSKIKKADCFVIADTFEFGGQSMVNRNRIRTNAGVTYLTIPLGRSVRGKRICDITLPSINNWKIFHWKLIHDSYAKTSFFNDYVDFFYELYKKDFTYLWQMNIQIISYLMKCFNIEVEILKASEMDLDPNLHKSDSIIALLKTARADIYLSGPSGSNYLEFEKFHQNNIDLKFAEFNHPIYTQKFPGFEPNLSAIDLLFNVGPEASRIIEASGRIVTSQLTRGSS